MTLAIIAITPGGAELARRLGQALPDACLHLPERLRAEDQSAYFSEPLAELLPRLFSRGDALCCIMATGIVARLLAPHLRGKAVDPAVVVMDEAGEFAISLFSGHLGGANELACRLARISGGRPVITTATDVNGLSAWDDVARRAGLVVEPVKNIKHLNSMLLYGEKIALVDRRGRVARYFSGVPGVFAAGTFSTALHAGAAGMVFVTHRLIPHLDKHSNLLLLRPRDLVVGIGCNRGTSVDEIESVVLQELKRAFLSSASIASLATIIDKADEPGLNEFARRLDLPIEHHEAAALNQVSTPTPASAHVMAAVGARGVCEPAAILSAGGGPLLVTKQKRGNVTVAIAEKL
ncbi:cobalt-precorrin 5A hydrolase [Trichloromonas sp.]|uniref:cobalt-precorrin 5A hydrolase n=1 Tax=Trichloromonas sp. TaxID=3069249 RepID=UPI003D817F8F